jgi:hypothetical protein
MVFDDFLPVSFRKEAFNAIDSIMIIYFFEGAKIKKMFIKNKFLGRE